jgi:transcriptional regulator with XRE-family HTH domain
MGATLATASYTLRLTRRQGRIVPEVTRPSDLTAQLLGRRIASIRKARGLNQTELGRLAGGVPQTTVSAWENGSMCPNVVDLVRLAEVLSVNPAKLLDDDVISIEELPASVAEEVHRHADAIMLLLRRNKRSPRRRHRESGASP